MKKWFVGVVGAVAFTGFAADTWWVDCQMDDYAGHDGKSEEAAFKSIQEAVDAAAAGDTIKVKPGDYNKGVSESTEGTTKSGKSRVRIDKRLTIEGTGSAADTFVTGELDSDPTYSGCGVNAVRCFYILTAAKGTVIANMTIRNGGTHFDSQGACNLGGGVLGCDAGGLTDAKTGNFIVDCVITGCVGTRGAAAHSCNLVRTLVEGNIAPGTGTKSILRDCALYNCVVCHNRSGAYLSDYPNDVINCTIYGNSDGNAMFQAKKCRVLNSILLVGGSDFAKIGSSANPGQSNDSSTYVTNCVSNVSQGPAVIADSVTNATRYQTRSGATSDADALCLVASSPAVGRGTADYLNLIPEAYRDKDFYGKPRTTNGKVNCGAVEDVASCGSGVIFCRGGAFTDVLSGMRYVQYDHVYPLTEPGMLKLTPVVPAGDTLYSCWVETDGAGITRFPDPDDAFGVYAPPGGVVQLTPAYATAVLYVDDAVATNELTNGSAERPYHTIQQAIDAAGTAEGDATVIRVAEGVYDEDAVDCWGLTRVKIDRHVFIRGAGAGKSVIKGAADPDVALNASPWGCGPKAVRCVANVNITAAIQGFTLTDGRVPSLNDKDTFAKIRGGCYLDVNAAGTGNGANKGQVLDCVITNGVATRGSAVDNGRTFRSLIVNCRATSNGNTQDSAFLFGCVLKDNYNGDTIGNGACAYNCTVFQSSGQLKNSYGKSFNSILDANNGTVPNIEPGYCDGCIYWKVNISATPPGDYQVMDPCFVSEASRDLRICSQTAVVGQGRVSAIRTDMMSTCYDGYPVVFKDGRPTPGAYQSLVPVVAVQANGNATVAGGALGTNVLASADAEVTVTVDSPGSRRFIGLEVDGERLDPSVTEYTFRAPSAPLFDSHVYALKAVYASDYYVNANADDDGGNGWTPETAKKTLTGILAVANRSGDVVHAADGEYRDGCEMTPGATCTYARAVVPEGVTLKSDNGYAAAAIVGADAPDGVKDEQGCGAGATRCVYLAKNAKVSGFTLRGGRVGVITTSNTADHNAGAAQGADRDTSVVEDCYVTDNRGVRGGAIHTVTANRCQFTGNRCWRYGSVGYSVALRNCLVWDNDGMHVTQDGTACGCTFGTGNWSKGDATWTTPRNVKSNVGCPNVQPSASKPDLANCLIVDGVLFQNSIVAGSVVNSNISIPDASKIIDSPRVTYDEMKLGENFRPLPGSAAIDAGSNAWVTVQWDAKDVEGLPRVSNARVDAGCYEHDWRVDYAKMLGRTRYLTVTEADPEVYADPETGRVVIPAGAHLAAEVTKTGADAIPILCAWSVAARGTLSVAQDGAIQAYAAGDHSETRNLSADKTTFDFTADAADAALASLKANLGMIIYVR